LYETRPMNQRRYVFLAIGIAVALAFYTFVLYSPPGPRSGREFEPARLADREVKMWQAYYAREKVRLFALLLTTLREQYRYTWAKTSLSAFYLARAATTFANARADYDRVLPDLERAYSMAKDWTGARFNPAAVAQAELAWWVARRTPGKNSAESVGTRIAVEYALLYEVPFPKVLEPAMLRAKAAAIRDQGGKQANWPMISQLLNDSYTRLHTAVSAQ
jgi:hypothetical protein